MTTSVYDAVPENLDDLIDLYHQVRADEQTVRLRLYESLAAELQFAGHGRQMELVRRTGLSRETLRKLSRTYYRSIIRRDGACAFISQPGDNLHPDVRYEIRDEDRTTVLGHAMGQQILNLRRQQLAKYLSDNPSRTNIAVVDIAPLLPGNA